MSDTWGGLKLTWDEWHMIVCGYGDGVAFTTTDIDTLTFVYGKDIRKELHYYKFGLALGRLTWALIICSLIIRLA